MVSLSHHGPNLRTLYYSLKSLSQLGRAFLLNKIMLKISFRNNLKEIIGNIEKAQQNIEKVKIEGLKEIAKETFKNANEKYVVKGKFAEPSKSGKSLNYKAPPGADISVKKTEVYNPKTKFRKWKLVPMFIKGKIVSRSGDYEKTLEGLASMDYKQGNNFFNGVRVFISKNGIKIFADDKSKFFKFETRKQLGKTAIQPITKSLKVVARLWNKIRLLNK